MVIQWKFAVGSFFFISVMHLQTDCFDLSMYTIQVYTCNSMYLCVLLNANYIKMAQMKIDLTIRFGTLVQYHALSIKPKSGNWRLTVSLHHTHCKIWLLHHLPLSRTPLSSLLQSHYVKQKDKKIRYQTRAITKGD